MGKSSNLIVKKISKSIQFWKRSMNLAGRGRCHMWAQFSSSHEKTRQCSMKYTVQNEVAFHTIWLRNVLWTDQRMDGWTDWRSYPHIEMRERIKKASPISISHWWLKVQIFINLHSSHQIVRPTDNGCPLNIGERYCGAGRGGGGGDKDLYLVFWGLF